MNGLQGVRLRFDSRWGTIPRSSTTSTHMKREVLTSGVKRPSRDASHQTACYVQVKNVWSCNSTSNRSPWCLAKYEGQLCVCTTFSAARFTTHLHLLFHISALKDQVSESLKACLCNVWWTVITINVVRSLQKAHKWVHNREIPSVRRHVSSPKSQ